MCFLELWQQVVSTLDRSGKELHEKQHIERKVNEIVFGFLFPIDFYEVGKGLERVERDAKWKQAEVVSGHKPEANQGYHRGPKPPTGLRSVDMGMNAAPCIEGEKRDANGCQQIGKVVITNENHARQEQNSMLLASFSKGIIQDKCHQHAGDKRY